MPCVFRTRGKPSGNGRHRIEVATSSFPEPYHPALTSAPRSSEGSPALPIRAVDSVVRRAQAGSADAFAQLYDQHAARLFAVCVGLTGARQAAAELVQDTFVRAWEKLHTYRGEAAFSTWLHRIAVNVMLEQERAHRRRTMRVASDGDLPRTPEGVTDAPVSPRDVIGAVDLEQAIARLPEGCRRVFILHDIVGYAHAEIAAQLDLAEGTCKAHLFRARRLLRGMLDP